MRKNDTLKQAVEPSKPDVIRDYHTRPVTEKQHWAPDATRPDEIPQAEPTYVRGDIEPELKG